MEARIMHDEALIDLQHAHVTQLTEEGVKGDWHVRQNITSDELFILPGNLTEKDVFTILEFGRKFELEAFNAGIAFQKDKQNALLLDRNAVLAAELEAVKAHANMLAERVDKFTRGEN